MIRFGFVVCFAIILAFYVSVAGEQTPKNLLANMSSEEMCRYLGGDGAVAKATERGISVEEACAEQTRFRKKAVAEAQKVRAIKLAVFATVAFVVIVIVFRARRWIAAFISSGWRRRSKGFRAWAFGSFFWAIGTLLFVWLVEPYGSRMHDDEILHIFSVMIVPPLFLGAMWFGYKRFVDLKVVDMQPTDSKTKPEDNTDISV